MRAPPAHATTEDLQRRAAEIRESIDRNLRQLEEQLQPDRVLSTVSSQLRVSGVALALTAGRVLLRHPKPVAAVGAAVLLYSLMRRRRTVRSYRRRGTALRGTGNVGRFARSIIDAARVVNSLRRGAL